VTSYVAYCGDHSVGRFKRLEDALRALASCNARIRVDRCETALSISPEELAAILREAIVPGTQRPGRGSAAEQPVATDEESRDVAAVVFDQMFKRFAEILDRELRDERLVFHEVIGRGLEKPLRVAERIYQQPAKDDYDVLRLLEDLSTRHSRIIFFTGDRRLAAQARALPGVSVVYLPPGEVAGKEMAIKLMKKEIIKRLKGA